MLMMEERQPDMRTPQGSAISVLQEAGAAAAIVAAAIAAFVAGDAPQPRPIANPVVSVAAAADGGTPIYFQDPDGIFPRWKDEKSTRAIIRHRGGYRSPNDSSACCLALWNIASVELLANS